MMHNVNLYRASSSSLEKRLKMLKFPSQGASVRRGGATRTQSQPLTTRYGHVLW